LFSPNAMTYYRSPGMGPLIDKHPKITTGVIVMHGTDKNANDYYCWMEESVDIYFKNRDDVFLVAPKIILRDDDPDEDILYWDGNSGWKSGGESSVDLKPRVSFFDVLDEIVRIFSNKTLFPAMKEIVVAGHSAGGQTIQRYTVGTTVDASVSKQGITLRYFIANPSSYAYLDSQRVLGLPPSPSCGRFCDAVSIPSAKYSFANPSPSTLNCSTYNNWKYGFDDLNTYMSRTDSKQLIKNYSLKDVVYVLGNDDTCNNLFHCGCDDMDMDTGCEAELQGLCRYERGYIYYTYLQQFYKPAKGFIHHVVSVPNVGHDGCGMLTSPNGVGALFSPNYV